MITGWHIATPLSPFIFDMDLLEEFPGPWVNKNRMLLHSRKQEDIQELQDRSNPCYSVQEVQDHVDGAASAGTSTTTTSPVVKVTKDPDHQWTEIHNPLPSIGDGRDYHQIPL